MILGVLVIIVMVTIIVAMKFRRVVTTNMVDIVQSRRKTTPYGTGQTAGNVYYAWPSALPVVGVSVINLPVSNFDLSLKNYEAYDKDRVPFIVDVTSFFRIKDTAKAAQRVKNIKLMSCNHNSYSLFRVPFDASWHPMSLTRSWSNAPNSATNSPMRSRTNWRSGGWNPSRQWS